MWGDTCHGILTFSNVGDLNSYPNTKVNMLAEYSMIGLISQVVFLSRIVIDVLRQCERQHLIYS